MYNYFCTFFNCLIFLLSIILNTKITILNPEIIPRTNGLVKSSIFDFSSTSLQAILSVGSFFSAFVLLVSIISKYL